MNYILSTLLSLFIFTHLCPAADRVALVIGNNAYQHGPPLKNCVNDAHAVAAGLEACGFAVTILRDGSLRQLEEKVREFKKAATGAKAAWFHYCGHGAQFDGENYLIPVDADVRGRHELRKIHKAFPLDQLLSEIEEAKTPLKVVVLDCCRDYPFGERSWGGSRGLAQLEKEPEDAIIAYATAPGKTAVDGNGAHSLFTSALLFALQKPGLEILDVFRETGQYMQMATNRKQEPWIQCSFFGSFVLRMGKVGDTSQPVPPSVTPQAQRSSR